MSTLKVNNIGKTTGSTQDTMKGLAKAWLEGDSNAVTDVSFNISGGTDHGTGDYSYSVTSSFSTQYTVQLGTPRTTVFDKGFNTNTARRTSSVLAFEIGDPHTQAQDDIDHIILANGDLA